MANQSNKTKPQEVKPGQSLAELAAQTSATQEGQSPTPGATFPEGGAPAPVVEGEGQENSDNDTNERPGDEDLSGEPLAKPTEAKLLGETSIIMGQGEPDPHKTVQAVIDTAATQADAVKASLRGMTTSIVHVDEAAYQTAPDSGVSGKIVDAVPHPLNFGTMTTKSEVTSIPVQRADTSRPLKAYPATISILGKSVLRQLDEYAINMDPRKSATIESINQHQVALYRSLITTINKLTNDFQYVWEGILAAVNENKNGVFDEMNMFRGAQTIPLSADERNTFFRLLNLIKITAEPKGRSYALKQVDPSASLSTGDILTHEGRDKVMSYFKL